MATRRVFNSRHRGITQRPHSAAMLGLPLELYSDQTSTEPNTLLDTGLGSVGPGAIVDGTISPSKFDPTIRPPIYYDGALAPSDSSVASLYTEGALLFWGGTSGNKKLWRHNGTTFVISVDAADITVNQIVAGQIEAGAIGVSHLQVGGASLLQKGANLIPNPSFELDDVFDTYGVVPKGWSSASTGCAMIGTTANAKTGTHALVIYGLLASFPAASVVIDVVPGKTYRFGGWLWRGGGTTTGYIRMDTLDKAGATVTTGAGGYLTHNSETPTFKEGQYTIPSDGTVSKVRFYCYIGSAAATATDIWAWEDVFVEELPDNIRNSDGNVIIDQNGITINNGKLYLNDEFNNSVLAAAGWAGSWSDFNTMGLYNAVFSSGSTGTIANGRTTDLPYWEVTKGSMALTRTASASWPGGAYLRGTWTSLQTGSIALLSDKVQVVGGMSYSLTTVFAAAVAAGSVDVSMNVVWYDGSSGYTSELAYYDSGTISSSVPQDRKQSLTFTAPIGSKFARVRVYLYSTGGANTIDIGSVGFHVAPPAIDFDGSHDVDALTVQALSVASIPTFADNTFLTWTPSIGGDGSPSYSSRTGWYLKIGKMVFCSGYVVWSSSGSGSGEITVTTPTSPWRGARQTLNASIESFTGHSNGPASLLTFTSGSGATWDRLRGSGGNVLGNQATAPCYLIFNGWYREA